MTLKLHAWVSSLLQVRPSLSQYVGSTAESALIWLSGILRTVGSRDGRPSRCPPCRAGDLSFVPKQRDKVQRSSVSNWLSAKNGRVIRVGRELLTYFPYNYPLWRSQPFNGSIVQKFNDSRNAAVPDVPIVPAVPPLLVHHSDARSNDSNAAFVGERQG